MTSAVSTSDSDVIWVTQVKRRLSDGLVRGVDRSLWMCRSVPMAPIADAESDEARLAAAEPLFQGLNNIAELARLPVTKRRVAAKGAYREVQVLLVNVPHAYVPPRDHPGREYLAKEYKDRVVWNRVLILAVRLIDKTAAATWRETVNRVADTLVAGESPISAFSEDIKRVSAAMARSGLDVPTDEQMRLAENWCNLGDSPDVPVVPCADHMHVFDSVGSARAAVNTGLEDCSAWPYDGNHVMTFSSVSEFDLPFVGPIDQRALWAMSLVNREALAISLRGKIEPGQITGKELKRNAKRYLDDMQDRENNAKSTDSDQVQNAAQLETMRSEYELNPRAVLTDASVLVALPQSTDPSEHDRVQDLHIPGLQLRPMTYRQREAWLEMQLASGVKANPHRHDLPSETVACAGLPSRTKVGDPSGALMGFTLTDDQPAYLDWAEGARKDKPAVGLFAGGSGSGKTQLALRLSHQFSFSGHSILIDPKSYDDDSRSLSWFFHNAGGDTFSLDNVVKANGCLDSIRLSENPEYGIQMAVSVLGSVRPFGNDAKSSEAETYLSNALNYGVQNGARSTGSALKLAMEASREMPDEEKILPEWIYRAIERQMSNPMFRAIVGMDEDTGAGEVFKNLTSNRLTLVQVGRQRLELPDLNQKEPPNLEQRIGMTLVRMLVYGCTRAVASAGGGAVSLDEAWLFLQSGLSELDKIARLGRSMNVAVLLYTQKPSDAVGADFENHLSRVGILHLKDPKEAKAACELAGLRPDPDRLRLIGNQKNGIGQNTLRHIERINPETGKPEVVRGSVVLYTDLEERMAATEVYLSKAFLYWSSTKPEHAEQRKRDAERRRIDEEAGIFPPADGA